jgi:hypothetical protein
MATTAHTTISPATIIKGTPYVRSIKPASTYKPADACYLTAEATATHQATGTAICKLIKPAFLEFMPRIVASVRKDADDAYATTDVVNLIIGGEIGPLKLVIKLEDPTATLYPGHNLMPSNTAGSVEKSAGAGTGDIIDPPIYLAVSTVTGDTYATAWMY